MQRKRTLLVLSMIGACLSFSWLGVLQSANGEKTPRQIWDFGFVPQKCEVSHRFYLHNPDSLPLLVSKIKAGCSCVSVPELPEPIAPGDSVAIPVTFKSGRYLGHVNKTTKVYAGDEEDAFQSLTIIANVVKKDETPGYIRVIPPQLEWRLKDGAVGTDSELLTILNDGPGKYHVSLLDFPSDIVHEVKFLQGDKLDREIQILLTLSNERVSPDLRSPSITLSFEGQDTTIVTIPIALED